MRKTVTYADLERFLTKLRFEKRRVEVDDRVAIIFRHAPSGAELFLKDYRANQPVESYNLLAARSTLDGYGVLDRDEFDKALEDACTTAKAG
jgi:hypothetical protein